MLSLCLNYIIEFSWKRGHLLWSLWQWEELSNLCKNLIQRLMTLHTHQESRRVGRNVLLMEWDFLGETGRLSSRFKNCFLWRVHDQFGVLWKLDCGAGAKFPCKWAELSWFGHPVGTIEGSTQAYRLAHMWGRRERDGGDAWEPLGSQQKLSQAITIKEMKIHRKR